MPVPYGRALVLAALSLTVASVATVAAVYQRDPATGVRTGAGPSQAEELYLQPGTPPTIEPAGLPTTTTTVAHATTTVASKSAAPFAHVDTPDERGCIPGTYNARNGSCTTYPSYLDGRVTDLHGRAIEGICVYQSAALPDLLLARTDANGHYRTDQAASTSTTLVFATCPDSPAELGWVSVTTHPTSDLRPGETGTLDVTMTEAGGVYGQVVDTQGRPVPNLCVASRTIDESISGPTDAQGRFALPGVVLGDQVVWPDIGLAQCPVVGVWDDLPTTHVVSGQWTGVTIVMTGWATHAGPPFDPQ